MTLVAPRPVSERSERTYATVGEDTPAFPIREGDAVYIPANTLHSTYNTTWRPLRLVVVYTPGGAETGLDALPDARILDPGVPTQWSQAR